MAGDARPPVTAGERLDHVEITHEEALRAWLAAHHDQRAGVWIVTWKKHVPDRHVTREQVLDQLTAFGWTDGILRRVDEDRTRQLVSRRRTRPWAKSLRWIASARSPSTRARRITRTATDARQDVRVTSHG